MSIESQCIHMDEKVPFLSLCGVFEEMASSKGVKQRIETLERMWKGLRGADFFPFMRLLLPHLDTVRSTYGIKVNKMAKYYIEILGLEPTSTDAVRLTKWKDPTKTTIDVTHFSDVVFTILQGRGHNVMGPGISVKDLNSRLDELAASENSEKRRKVLLNLLRVTSPSEQKWILRVLLKDMRLHMQHTSIFGAFHPNALETFNATNSLQVVCQKCTDLTVLEPSEGAKISLMQPFKPMLAGHVDPPKLSLLLQQSKVVVEAKFDGERIMIHKNGDNIQYWTRNAKDYTAVYGPKFNPIVLQSVRSPSVILDGEMLVWDGIRNQFKDFGSNRTHGNAASDQKTDGGGGVPAANEWFCYCCFDIVLCHGELIANLPLDQRKARLDSVIVESPHHLEKVVAKPVTTIGAVLTALDTAIERKYEGIMLKVVDSSYVPGERKLKWLKLKADHIHGLADSLDLLVLGGYYGTKYAQRHLSHFLLGVHVDTAGGSPLDDGAMFHTMMKVGTGYSDSELKNLLTRVGDKWRPWDKERGVPSHFDGWKPSADDVPDVWIDPRDSIVLEVIGYSFTETLKFRTGFTLRFPRCLRVRYDKGVPDAMTLSQARSFYGMNINTTKAIHFESEFMTHRKAKKTKASGRIQAVALPKRFYASLNTRPIIASEVPMESTIFEGYEVCVLQADYKAPRDVLERIVIAHGGNIVANPTPHTAIVIAAHAKSPKVVNWIEAARRGASRLEAMDIVHFSWMHDSVSAGKVLPYAPRYMLYTSPRLKALFDVSMDAYMDSYFDPTTVDGLRASLDVAIAEVRSEEKKRPRDEEQEEMDSSLTQQIHSLKQSIGYYAVLGDTEGVQEIFANTVVYVARGPVWDPLGDSCMQDAEIQLCLHGACVVPRPDGHAVTHIIVNPKVPDTLQKSKEWGSHFVMRVGPRWVLDSVAKGIRLDPRPYTVQTDINE